MPKLRRWQTVFLDCLLLVLITGWLMRPWFRLKWSDNWGSIESTFIGDARWLKENWPRPRWQPLWYCGTRFDYIYPPAIRYGTAVITKYVPRVTPAKAYHIYTGLFYCVGIAGVYAMVRAMSDSRRAGWLAALAAGFISPSFLLLPEIRADAIGLASQRLSALVRYGEGPHMTALAWIPIALAACWFALRRFGPVSLPVAAASCALVVSNNFYGATALAIFYPVLVWSLWITHQDPKIAARAAIIPLAAAGLCAWWLTPSYLNITLRNLAFVSQPGNLWSRWILLAAAILFMLATDRWAKGRRAAAWPVFVIGSALFHSLNTLGNAAFNFRVIGEPGRLIPELDLALILAAILLLERMWTSKRAAISVFAWALAIASFWPAAVFLKQRHEWYPPQGRPEDRVEYQVSKWLAANLPGERVFLTGAPRLWSLAFFDIPQVGGGSEQGLLNPVVQSAQWEINLGPDPALSAAWLQALGATAIAVHGPKSQEMYHDTVTPGKFQGAFELLYGDQADNYVYRTPRKHSGIGRIVRLSESRAYPAVPWNPTNDWVQGYAKVVEGGPERRVEVRRPSSEVMDIRGALGPDEAFVIQENYDSGWRAIWQGRVIAVEPDPIGFMRIPLPPGEHSVRLEYRETLGNQAGQAVFWITLLGMGAYASYGWRRFQWL